MALPEHMHVYAELINLLRLATNKKEVSDVIDQLSEKQKQIKRDTAALRKIKNESEAAREGLDRDLEKLKRGQEALAAQEKDLAGRGSTMQAQETEKSNELAATAKERRAHQLFAEKEKKELETKMKEAEAAKERANKEEIKYKNLKEEYLQKLNQFKEIAA